MSNYSFIILSVSICVLFPVLCAVCLLFGVHVGFKKQLVQEMTPPPEEISGYVPYVDKQGTKYKAYIPGKSQEDDELDS